MAPVVPLGPSVIAGASSLLGGVFGRSKQPGIKKQYRLGRENTELLEKNKYKWIVEGARKAGFNPLTALRATGGNLTTAPQPQSPLSSRSYIGEAIKTFGGTYAQDAIQRATEARQNEEWQRRYDYQRENPVPVLSPRTKDVQKTEQMNNRINVGGDRASDYLITDGSLAGRYVLPVGEGFRLAPRGWVPAGLTEDLFAGLASEVEGAKSSATVTTWPEVSVDAEGRVTPPAPEKQSTSPGVFVRPENFQPFM